MVKSDFRDFYDTFSKNLFKPSFFIEIPVPHSPEYSRDGPWDPLDREKIIGKTQFLFDNILIYRQCFAIFDHLG